MLVLTGKPLLRTPMQKRINVAYLEDQKVVREGLNFLLSQYDFLNVVDAEINVDHVEDFVKRNNIDVFILDLQLQNFQDKKNVTGYDICVFLRSRFPNLKMIGHSMYDDVESANKIFSSGGIAFVSKKSGHVELINAIKAVVAGERYICRETEKKTKNAGKFLKGEDATLQATKETFTKAEKSILEKIAKGYSTKQIAQQLGISEKTVETHRKNLFTKAEVKNVAELIAFAYSQRIFID